MGEHGNALAGRHVMQKVANRWGGAEKGHVAPYQDVNAVVRIVVLDPRYDEEIRCTDVITAFGVTTIYVVRPTAAVFGHYEDPVVTTAEGPDDALDRPGTVVGPVGMKVHCRPDGPVAHDRLLSRYLRM
jgi:hypothetical protein